MKVENLEKLVTKVYDSLKNNTHYNVIRLDLSNQQVLIVNDLVTHKTYYLDFFDNKLFIKTLGLEHNKLIYYCSSYNQFLSIIYNSIK